MVSSVTDAVNPQGGKKCKDKNKDLAVLVDERLVEINNSMAALMDRMDNIEKHLEELEFIRDFKVLRGEVQVAVNAMVADVNKEIHALWASEAV